MKRYLGIDVGAETLKIVELHDEDGAVRMASKMRVAHHKAPAAALREALEGMDYGSIDAIAVCGRLGRLFKLMQIPEKQARSAGFRYLVDDAPVTIVSIGSHGFSVLEMRDADHEIYRENTRCSQGTGNFLMQLVERFGLTVEEASALCEDVTDPAPLSGRCPVILKTDMTHLANAGTSHARIVAGLYDAVCENVQVLIKPALCPHRMLLTGGVMQSGRIRNHFARYCAQHGFEQVTLEDDLGLYIDAIGCAILAASHKAAPSSLDDVFSLKVEKHIEHIPNIAESLKHVRRIEKTEPPKASERPDARLILGYDMGSTGSKVVAIDAEDGAMLWDAYENTKGNPIGAAQDLTRQFLASEWAKNPVVAVGTTGSGREIVGSLLSVCYTSAPVYILNEIAAHAEGAVSYDSRVDTIFEIGGQDAKYIRIDGGRVIDAAMNEACSAGTGSFIEEQGRRFEGVKDVRDLGRIALGAQSACSLGQHCSVFMAEIIDEAVATGEKQEEIIAGIYDSIIQNYLNRVKGSRTVGQVIFCQGMPFSSDALAAAVARRTGCEVIVPPNPGTIGAQGIALLARRYKVQGVQDLPALDMSRFLGAEIIKKDNFICNSTKGCGGAGNKCRIERILTRLEGQESRFTWGGGCSLYDKGTGRIKLPDLAPDPFRAREEYIDKLIADLPQNPDGKLIAMSEEFTLKGLLPFFVTILADLGYRLDIFRRADQAVLKRGIEEANIPFCAPMQLFHGITSTLLERKPDILFQPMLLSTPAMADEDRSVLCPIVQGAPKMNYWDTKSSKNSAVLEHTRFFSPIIDFQPGDIHSETFKRTCRKMVAELLEKSEAETAEVFERVFEKSVRTQVEFEEQMLRNGDEALAYCEIHDIPAVVVLGRVYTIHNKVLNSNVPAILREQGAIAIPIDCYRLGADVPLFKSIFWGYSMRNLRSAHQVRRTKNVYSVWCSNYACGPDSFSLHFYGYIMEGKPYAVIETDGHSGDAGTRTRIEAFLHCVREHIAKGGEIGTPHEFIEIERRNTDLEKAGRNHETIIIPRLGPGSRTLAAALRGLGFDAEAMKIPTRETLALGRKYTSGKECVPMTLTLGLLLERVANEPDKDRKFTFLMPTGRGPCRFGNYNHLHKITLERLGLTDRVNVWSPSDNNYFEGIPGGTVALAFCGIVAADLLLSMRYDARPDEIVHGSVDALYEKLADELDAHLEARAAEDGSLACAAREIALGRFYGLRGFLEDAAVAFKALSRREELPTVLVTGENYVRCDPFANDYVIDQLQARGIRVKLAPFYEWLDYQEYINTQVGIPQTWNSWFTAKIQVFILETLYNTAAKRLGWSKLNRAKDLLEVAEDYVRYQLEGEAGLTLGGGIVEWNRNEIDAVLALGPHECMPSKVAEAQYFHVSEELGIHSETLHLNGDPVDPVIIEHFAYEVRERFATRAKRRELHPAHEETKVEIAKNFLKELVRGLPKMP
ncbi:MAG: CoA activase [Proteobacteria bacterium]|nr:CoA activase [Pseudomonadota bacterium]